MLQLPINSTLCVQQVQYKYFLGDGDSRAFSAVEEMNLYPVEKLECLNHVQKRMGTRLRKYVFLLFLDSMFFTTVIKFMVLGYVKMKP
jgi:hypothetical protein